MEEQSDSPRQPYGKIDNSEQSTDQQQLFSFFSLMSINGQTAEQKHMRCKNTLPVQIRRLPSHKLPV